MHKPVVGITLVLLMGCGLPLASAASQQRCPSITTASSAEVSALADRINGVALTENTRRRAPWAAYRTPFAEWYARFVTSIGSSSPPTPQELRTGATLIRDLDGRPGVSVEASVWVNANGTTYGTRDERFLEDELCVSTIRSGWTARVNRPAPIEDSMRDWLNSNSSGEALKMRDAAGFVRDLSTADTAQTNRSSHLWNVLTTLFLRVRFDVDLDVWPQWVTVPYYEQDGVAGVRLRSSSSGLSLYLFTGRSDDLAKFGAGFSGNGTHNFDPSFSAAHWREIQAAFAPKSIPVAPIDTVIYARNWFMTGFDRGTSIRRAFGTTIGPQYNEFTGLDQGDLVVREREAWLTSVAGIEGSDAPADSDARLWPSPSPPGFAIHQSTAYFLVDDRTGTMLFNG